MSGLGTLLDPYVIWDVNDLQDMNLDLTAYYELGQDIDAAVTVGWNGGLGFDPIGNHPVPAFVGHFDGKGYKITDLVINRPLEDFVGLFGYTAGVGGEIKNVGLEDVDITGGNYSVAGLVGFNDDFRDITDCWVTGSVTFDCSAGYAALCAGFVGYSDGVISDCYFNGTFTNVDAVGRRNRQNGGFIGLEGGGTITRCWSGGTIIMTGVDGSETEELGGFAGLCSGGSITRCFSTMDISIESDGVWGIGGFIGDNDGTVQDCYARGDVVATIIAGPTTYDNIDYVAGFVGYNGDTIGNCYSTGLVSATATTTSYVGGFCGEDGGTVTDCFWDIDTSGQAASDGGTGELTVDMKLAITFTAAGWGFGAEWGMTPPCNNGYPCLLNVTSGCLWVPAVAPAYRVNRAHALSREEL